MARMTRKDRLIQQGWFDRFVSILANLPGQVITGLTKAYRKIITQTIGQNPDFDRLDKIAAGELLEAARLSVNAARRMEQRDDDGVLGTHGTVPCIERPGERCDGQIEYRVVVEVVDPVNGGRFRGDVVVVSDKGLTRTELEAAATAVAIEQSPDRSSPVRGEFDPSQGKFSEMTIIGVSTRR